jgi:hypothetical protein
MMSSISKRLAINAMVCGLGSLIGVSEATAAVISVSVPFTTSPVASNGQQTGWTFSGSIPQFSLSLPGINADCLTGDSCILTGVSLQITDTATGSVTFTAPSNPNGSLSNFSIGSVISYTNPFTGAIARTAASYDVCDGSNVGLISSPTPNCDLALDSLSFAANQQIQASLRNTAVNSATTSSTSSTILNELLAGPLAILGGSTKSYVSGDDSNNVTSVPDVTAFVAGQATFTYSDTAPSSVPEPTSLAVLAVGLLGVGSARRWIDRR